MKAIVDLCIIPIGVGNSLSKYIASCEDIFKKNKIKSTLHANGTNLEGEWDLVMLALKECHEKLHSMGAPRVFTTVKIGTRTDKEQSMEDKIESVQKKQAIK